MKNFRSCVRWGHRSHARVSVRPLACVLWFSPPYFLLYSLHSNCLHEGRRSAPSSPVCCRRRSGQRATRHDFVPVCALRRPAPCPGGYGERFAHTRRQHRAHGAVYGRQGPVLSAMRPRAAAHAAFQTDPPMAACSRGVPCSQARISTAKSFQTQHTPHHPYIAHEIYKFYETNNTQARDHTHIITYYYLYVMMMYYDDDVSNTLCPAR